VNSVSVFLYSPNGLPITEKPNAVVFPNDYFDKMPSEEEDDHTNMVSHVECVLSLVL
jgi:hypothetical protein